MKITSDSEFRSVCGAIVAQERTLEEWASVESDDMFQSENYVGGFDADEMEFCFSYYDGDGQEFWFQIPLDVAIVIASGEQVEIELSPADT